MKKQTKPEELPEELVWAAGGHASDVALTAMADGQVAIVPKLVLAHVERCTTCTTHLGNAALLSLHTGREIATLATAESATHEVQAAARAPLPRLAIALGLAFAALGLVPSFTEAPPLASGAKAFAMHDVPMFANGIETLGRRLLEPGSPVGVALTYGAAALLVVMAIALVRFAPKKEASR
jgi:hypothetical protein